MSQTSSDTSFGPELYIGIVSTVGTDLENVNLAIQDALADVNYDCKPIWISKILHSFDKWRGLSSITDEYERLQTHMDAGLEFCELIKRADAMALLGISSIREYRKTENLKRRESKKNSDQQDPIPRCAYLFRSLKRPEEVEILREIYGPYFILVAAYTPRDLRVINLAKKVAYSRGSNKIEMFMDKAQFLIQRDEKEQARNFGQNVSETFPLADVFIDASDNDRLRGNIKRFIEIFFRYPYHTPTRDEYSMFHAQAAALRSSSLSRQVGAVISTIEGDIIAVGTNDVPKSGGGLYWSDDNEDYRDFKIGYEQSDIMKKNIIKEVIQVLEDEGYIKEGSETGDKLFMSSPSMMENTQVMDLLEFGRAIHAEMAALLDASRRGISVKNCSLYTTTFPCHSCARHIVNAGIKRVVYIEPYPKSLAFNLHADSIDVDSSKQVYDKVSFESFVGISPRRYMDLFIFSKDERMRKDGKIIEWEKIKKESLPKSAMRFPYYFALREEDELDELYKRIKEKGLTITRGQKTKN